MMDERERYGAIRGEPIVAYVNRPSDIPCRETSDPFRLSKSPLVSVVMTAYNHGKYIREAIEGVLCQRTDFPFELVIGEDCSPDDTRAICLDYQRRFPDRIRVLWSESNVFGAPGGNENRIQAQCRGEFLAYCEGDDYWTDPLKLQKQVDLLRRYPTAGMCFGGTDNLRQRTGEFVRFQAERMDYGEYMSGRDFASSFLTWKPFRLYGHCLHTSATLVRRTALESARLRFPEIYGWFMRSTDYPRILGISGVADACFLKEPVSVWRLENGTGLTERDGARSTMDDIVCRIYFAARLCDVSLAVAMDAFSDRLLWQWLKLGFSASAEVRREMAGYVEVLPELKGLFSRWYSRPVFEALRSGSLGRLRYRLLRFVLSAGFRLHKRPALAFNPTSSGAGP